MGAPISKDLRVNLRIDAESKKMLERAAAYAGSSLSDFVLANALAAAGRTIEEREKIVLSAADWEVFLDALDNPPKPNKRLKDALRRHRELYG